MRTSAVEQAGASRTRRWASHRSFIVFGIVGALGTACHFLTLFLLVHFAALDIVTASTLGAMVGAAVNYLLNQHFTFRDAPAMRRTAPRYVFLVVLLFFNNAWLVYVFAHLLAMNYIAAQSIATGLVFLINYVVSSYWVFKGGSR